MAVWDSARRSAASRYSHPWLAEIIFALDALLRHQQAVVGYTSHPSCVFRLRVARARHTLVLRDGTRLGAGQRMIELHFWNAHIPPVPLSWYLILSAVLFAIGVAGFLYRKSIITVFMSIELMLNAVNLSFIAFSYQLRRIDGHIYSFFVMVVAAAEAAVGLAIVLTVFKNRGTLQIDEVDSMKL